MHDRNGTPLKIGDVVTMPMRLIAVYGGDEYCNLTMSYGFAAEHGPHNVTGTCTANGHQVLLVERAPE